MIRATAAPCGLRSKGKAGISWDSALGSSPEEQETLVVVLNMSGQKHHVRFDLTGSKARTLLTTMRGAPREMPTGEVDLEPFAIYIGRINASCRNLRKSRSISRRL